MIVLRNKILGKEKLSPSGVKKLIDAAPRKRSGSVSVFDPPDPLLVRFKKDLKFLNENYNWKLANGKKSLLTDISPRRHPVKF